MGDTSAEVMAAADDIMASLASKNVISTDNISTMFAGAPRPSAQHRACTDAHSASATRVSDRSMRQAGCILHFAQGHACASPG
jgi:hypothetical protein